MGGGSRIERGNVRGGGGASPTASAAVAGLLALAGCWGGEPEDACVADGLPGLVGCVEGLSLVVPPDVTPAEEPAHLLAQAERALGIAASVWEVPLDTWSGWVVEVRDEWFRCPTPAGAAWSWGCAHPHRRLIQAAPGLDGCALGVLVHELGHAAGLADHFSPDGAYLFREADLRSAEICAGPEPGLPGHHGG